MTPSATSEDLGITLSDEEIQCLTDIVTGSNSGFDLNELVECSESVTSSVSDHPPVVRVEPRLADFSWDYHV